jgi:succinate dehydrogenase/fumarate reductase-like Fe-S protein
MTLKIFYVGNLTTTKNILKLVLTKHKTQYRKIPHSKSYMIGPNSIQDVGKSNWNLTCENYNLLWICILCEFCTKYKCYIWQDFKFLFPIFLYCVLCFVNTNFNMSLISKYWQYYTHDRNTWNIQRKL